MKQMYDVVKGPSAFSHPPPRVIQTRLKSPIEPEGDMEGPVDSEPAGQDVAGASLRRSLFSGESLRGTRRPSPVMEMSSDSIYTLASDTSCSSHVPSNLSYWLSFPSAMRAALMSSRRKLSFKRRDSAIPTGSLSSIDDLGLVSEARPRSFSLPRKTSLQRVISRRKGFFETDLSLAKLQGDEISWPRGAFKVAREKLRPMALRRSEYSIVWKEEEKKTPELSSVSEIPVPSEVSPKVPRRPSGTKRHIKYSSDDYYNSVELQNLYGDTPDLCRKKKPGSSLVSKWF